MDDSRIFCVKFDFGVPLEDIFPPNDIHPRLRNLFHQTLVALKESVSSLSDILKQLDISLNESLNLKEVTVKRNLRYNVDFRPSSFFWLLRHFFGLLPLPLFPSFTNGQAYIWRRLSTLCKLNRLRTNHDLESEISRWIHKLPKANILLIYSLLKFLRTICLRNYSSKRFDWDSIKAVTLYFSSSLFFRPYRPGLITKTDTLYYPLLYYLIVHWSKIRRINDYNDSAILQIIKNRLIDCSCQTSSWMLLEKIEEEERDESECSNAFEVPKLVLSEIISGLEDEILDDESVSEEKNAIIFVLEDQKLKERDESLSEEKNEVLVFVPEDKDKSVPEDKDKGLPEDKGKPVPEVIIATEVATPEESLDIEELKDFSSCDYEEILTDSEIAICKSGAEKFFTPNIIREKLSKANRSLVSVFSKMSGKLKSKQEQLKSRSGHLDRYKYDLLKDPDVKKIQSLHAYHCVKESPNIKYKKLMTL